MQNLKKLKLPISDYLYLLERAYSEKSALKLVGDHYRLDKTERNILFRGVFNKKVVKYRKAKQTKLYRIKNYPLSIDGYNNIITLESYLKGKPVFMAMDGLLRDSSGIHGSFKQSPLTEKSIELLLEFCQLHKPQEIVIYLDQPVSYSGELAKYIQTKIMQKKLSGTVKVVPSADYFLKNEKGIVSTSDSAIIDNCRMCIDLPYYIISKKFKKNVPQLTVY